MSTCRDSGTVGPDAPRSKTVSPGRPSDRMKTIETVAELREELARAARPLGLVPTMGALHNGHMALVDRAPPRQQEPFARASSSTPPSSARERISRHTRATWRPIWGSWSGPGPTSSSRPRSKRCTRTASTRTSTLAASPTGSRGSTAPATSAASPPSSASCSPPRGRDRAYFGQKDAQQCVVVKRLNADLDLGAEIVVVPTVREPDGLALSSRNEYLSPSERRAATVVHRALGACPVDVRRRRGRRLLDQTRGPGRSSTPSRWRASTTSASRTPTRSKSWSS